MSDSWPLHGIQHARLPSPSLSPRVCSDSYPLSWWCHPTISSSVVPLSLCPQSLPALGSFSISWLFASGGLSIGDSVSASVLLMNIQGWLVVSPCSPRDSEEFSPAPEFEGVNSSGLSLPYGPTLTSIYDYWKNHSFDYTDLCWQSDVSAF